MFQRDQIFSKTDIANYTAQAAEKMFDAELKTFFWTKHQKALIHSSPKRVLFTSAFGTGKTTLLKSKAKQLGESKQLTSKSEKVFFVVFTGQDALLTQSLKLELGEIKQIEVVSLTSEFSDPYLKKKDNFFIRIFTLNELSLDLKENTAALCNYVSKRF